MNYQDNIVDNIDFKNLKNIDYVKLAYLVLLKRKIDQAGLNCWQEQIRNGKFSYENVLDTILNSEEYKSLHFPFLEILHKGRQLWVKKLKRFNHILDIGGSCPHNKMGALVDLGYRYRAKETIIIDLPEDKQFWGKPNFDQAKVYSFKWGSVRYIHEYAENINNISELKELKFDLVFMGQTIEHIEKERLPLVLSFIREHLRKNGRFIFDTPNRDITKIQNPNSYVSPDHKYEYTPVELEKILQDSGFKIINKFGILSMPNTYKTKIFNYFEVKKTKILSKYPENSYVFAFECVNGR